MNDYPTSSQAPDPLTADPVTAVQYGFYDRVLQLIDADPSLVTKTDKDGVTLLHWAALNNRLDLSRLLINRGAKVDAIGGVLRSTPLYWAIREGKCEMAVLLISFEAQISLFDADGYAAIHLASMFGYAAIVAYLAAKGADVNQADKSGMTPLMHAASHVRERDPAQILIRLGAAVNCQHPITKNTPLHFAVKSNNPDVVRVLIDAGAKTNLRNADNDDAFEYAVKHQRAILYLLAEISSSNEELPKLLRFNPSIRLFATKLLPYFVLIAVGLILGSAFGWIIKGVSLLMLVGFIYGHMIVFADSKSQESLPIAIAQASIFSLYSCYLYFFLPYVHVISWSFFLLVFFTYLSWTSYYRAIRTDPGYITPSTDQTNRLIIQLVEQNLFHDDLFCTFCLLRRPIRSKHCRMCHCCVSKFDHHCPWINNCVGEKNLRSFTGFVVFTPICLVLFLYGAYLYFRDHCQVFSSDTFLLGLEKTFTCAPAVIWFTFIALLHTMWISSLAATILYQIAAGLTTNERLNYWRYKYLNASHRSPFSFGVIQNFVDLVNRKIFCYSPIPLDWSRLYNLEEFYQSIPTRSRRDIHRHESSHSTNV